MRTGRVQGASALLAAALLLALLGGCGGTATQPLPDLSGMGEVLVIAREEGSGTRSELEDLVGTDEGGADRIAVSTHEVLDQTAAERNAVGYAAYSAVFQEIGVKILAVDGVALSPDTIRSGRYPLCRRYSLAYLGTLSDLGADFLTYVLGAGQALVEQSCVPVGRATTFLSDKSAGTLTIQGSSSAAPLLEALIQEYKKYNPNGEITLTVTDSTAGLTAAIRGACDLAMSSRSLKDYEQELLDTVVFASDAIAVVVHPDNPLTGITKKQLKALLDGDTVRWADMEP